MLVKCVKYFDIERKEAQTSCVVEIGKCYPVLAIATSTSNKYVNYYIQASTNNIYIHLIGQMLDNLK